MNEITPEKTHALLEKLAEYVMNKIPAIESKLDQKADKTDIVKIADSVAKLQIDMQDVKATQQTMINNMDAQAKQLDVIRKEQAAASKTIDRHEERLAALEGENTDYRIREKGETKYTRKKE